jgi:hypothetical protein
MAKRRKTLARMSAEQAHQALTFLIHEGTVGVRTVEKVLANREKLLREVRERLAALGVEGYRLAKDTGGWVSSGLASAAKSGRKGRKRVSAAVKKTRQAQGKYLGAIRQLSKANRKRIKAIREKSGVNASIAAARKMAK